MPKSKPSRRRKAIRLNLDAFRGQWVALDPKTNRVVAHNTQLDAAQRDAVHRGIRRPMMVPVPESEAFFVGVHA
jgi:hypothetical protein